MELCTMRGAFSTPSLLLSSPRRFSPDTPHFRFPLQKLSNLSGVASISHTSRTTLLRVSSDETSSKFTEDKTDAAAVATFEDAVSSPSVDNDITLDKVSPVRVSLNEEERVYNENKVEESYDNDDDILKPLKELLNKLNIELDFEDTPTILLYGGGSVLAVWLLSAILGAIDSIPVFPKLMEVVGLGFSVWFTSRYLLFKKNREELGSKIEELKQEIFGPNDK